MQGVLWTRLTSKHTPYHFVISAVMSTVVVSCVVVVVVSVDAVHWDQSVEIIRRVSTTDAQESI